MMQETVKMQGEYQSGTASITPTAATFGDALTIVSASIPATPVVNNFSGLQLLCDNSAYSLSNTASLIPYKSVITPAAAAATEITSSSQALRTCMTSRQQDFINCHALCLSHPHNATKEVSSLRKENSKLCSINNRLSLIVQSYINDPSVPVGGDETKNRATAVAAVTAFDLANRHGRLCISENEVKKEGNSNKSPTRSTEGTDVDRMALPKSISVRSNEPWKGVTGQNPGEGNPPVAAVKGRIKEGCSSGTGKQKVYLRGGKKEEAQVELEVYNQGMFKTELCNKWQETGTCPYRDHCQFAHGIKELRPVIRHPRYKTEVCRLVLSGDVCPYGHRCHFRHSLTEQEKIVSMTPLKTAEDID